MSMNNNADDIYQQGQEAIRDIQEGKMPPIPDMPTEPNQTEPQCDPNTPHVVEVPETIEVPENIGNKTIEVKETVEVPEDIGGVSTPISPKS